MDDARRRRRGLAVGVHMRHHIMAHLALPPGGLLVVNIGDVGFQLRRLRLVLGDEGGDEAVFVFYDAALA